VGLDEFRNKNHLNRSLNRGDMGVDWAGGNFGLFGEFRG